MALHLESNGITSINSKSEDFLYALSITANYNINPVLDLVKKEFVTTTSTAENGFISETQEAFDSEQDDSISILPKLDFIWTPILTTNENNVEEGSRFGVLSSLSSRYNTNSGKLAHNFSIGPSVHPKWSSSNVIATIQFEFLDFSDSTGEKDFGDIFQINFYVGLPIRFKQ